MEKSSKNQVQKRYIDEEKKAIEELIKNLGSHFDLGVSLSTKERQTKPSVAKERMPLIRLGLKATKSYPNILPRDFDEAGYEDDVLLTEYLHDVLLVLYELIKKIEDIFIMAGAESYAATKMIRKILKAQHEIEPIYGKIIDEMDAFFKRTKSKSEDIDEEENLEETE